MDITPEQASERGGYGNEIFENLQFQKQVSSVYGNMALEDPTIVRIDAAQSVQSAHQSVVRALRSGLSLKPELNFFS